MDEKELGNVGNKELSDAADNFIGLLNEMIDEMVKTMHKYMPEAGAAGAKFIQCLSDATGLTVDELNELANSDPGKLLEYARTASNDNAEE